MRYFVNLNVERRQCNWNVLFKQNVRRLHEELKQAVESKDAVVAKLNSSIQALQANNEYLKLDAAQLTDKFK